MDKKKVKFNYPKRFDVEEFMNVLEEFMAIHPNIEYVRFGGGGFEIELTFAKGTQVGFRG